MSELVKWSSKDSIPSFENLNRGGREELDLIFSTLSHLNLPIFCEPSEDPEEVGYVVGNGILTRLTYDTGIMMSAIHVDHPLKYELGYIYDQPEHAIAWILCRLGFGLNACAYESEALLFSLPTQEKPLRLSFELPLTAQQVQTYREIEEVSTHMKRLKGPLLGSLVHNPHVH